MYIPGETHMLDTALVEALKVLNKFPVTGSTSQTIPSAPEVNMQEPREANVIAVTPLHEREDHFSTPFFISSNIVFKFYKLIKCLSSSYMQYI